MRFYEVQGLVLRRKQINSRDSYLTLFTREMGRIEVFAGGANAPKSPLNKGASPFVFGMFSLSGRGNYRLQHVEVIDGFYYLREDMERFLAASFVAQSLFAMLAEGEANRALYELSVNTIAIFHKYPRLILAAHVYFLYGAARAIGIEPAGPSCMVCERIGYVFNVEEGGFFCEKHMEGGRRLDDEEIGIFHDLRVEGLVAFLNAGHAPEALRRVRELLERYWLQQWDVDMRRMREELDEYRQEEDNDDHTGNA